MPFANLPLRFIAKAQTQGPRLQFLDSNLLVKYVPYDADDLPNERAAPVVDCVVRADNGVTLASYCWSIADVGNNGHARMLKVTFHGTTLNSALSPDLERLLAEPPVPPALGDSAAELHNAFLDQALINVQVLMSQDGVNPPYYTGLQLRLAYLEV
jgi:hypothetical protein